MNKATGPDHSRGRRRASVPSGLLLALAALALLVLLRDARVPLDGSAYAAAARDLLAGRPAEIFRWSHLLHVPFVAACTWCFRGVPGIDTLGLYQALDLVLGAVGMLLLHLLYGRLGLGGWQRLVGCLVVLLTWAYWSEAAMADEKMTGFACLLAFLVSASRQAPREGIPTRTAEARRGLLDGFLLAVAMLLHAAAVLAAPAMLAQALVARRWRYACMACAAAVTIVAAAYGLVFLEGMGESAGDTTGFFGSGVSSFSIFATRIGPGQWLREVAQGSTKVIWAVFVEDGMKWALLAAALAASTWLGVGLAAWRTRSDRDWLWVRVLLVGGTAFGLTYAPSAPDSYMVLVIPLGAYVARVLSRRPWRVWAVIALAPMFVFNLAQYVGFADESFGRPERAYQAAIGRTLAPGDTLVHLDAMTGVANGTQTILPIHRYANPGLIHCGSSGFLAQPAAHAYEGAARSGRLYIEGICFETRDTRDEGGIGPGAVGLDRLSGLYDLVPVIDGADYSRAYHRRYKGVFRLEPVRGEGGAAPPEPTVTGSYSASHPSP